MRRVWRVAVLLALVTVACRAEANVVVELNEDGTGIYTVELGVDEELQALLNGFIGADGDGGGLIPGFDFEIPGLEGNPLDSPPSRVEGDMTFYGQTRTFQSLDDLREIINNATNDANSFDTFDVVISEEQVRLTATAGAPGDLAPTDDLPISLDIFEQALTASVIVAMPGRVIEENADQVLPDGRLKWDISLTEGVNIQATSDLTESSFPWWIIVVVALAAAALALSLMVNRRNATRPTNALGAVDAPPDPTGFPSAWDDPPAG